MPSETIYVPDDDYSYALETKADDQSIGKRLQELVNKGIEKEQNDD